MKKQTNHLFLRKVLKITEEFLNVILLVIIIYLKLRGIL